MYSGKIMDLIHAIKNETIDSLTLKESVEQIIDYIKEVAKTNVTIMFARECGNRYEIEEANRSRIMAHDKACAACDKINALCDEYKLKKCLILN